MLAREWTLRETLTALKSCHGVSGLYGDDDTSPGAGAGSQLS